MTNALCTIHPSPHLFLPTSFNCVTPTALCAVVVPPFHLSSPGAPCRLPPPWALVPAMWPNPSSPRQCIVLVCLVENRHSHSLIRGASCGYGPAPPPSPPTRPPSTPRPSREGPPTRRSTVSTSTRGPASTATATATASATATATASASVSKATEAASPIVS